MAGIQGQTLVEIGHLSVNRGRYESNPSNTKYYKDNIVQYKGASYIADPPGYNAKTNPNAYITVAPWTTDRTTLNTGWHVFADGNPEYIEEVAEDNIARVNQMMADYQPIVIEGDVTNAADEEDITSVDLGGGTSVLKLKDKAYNSDLYSGLGRVYLRKNMVNGVNTLTQDMFYKGEVGSRVPNTNTIFVIQYDFTLGEDITIPANCILEFDGGSISGGKIIGNNSSINGRGSLNCTLSGSFTSGIDFSFIEGIVCDGVTDNTNIIVDFLNKCLTLRVTFNVPNYCYFDRDIVYKNIPKGSLLVNSNILGYKEGKWKAKYYEIVGKDDENDDTTVVVASGHYPCITLVNTGSCDYTAASSIYQKSGLWKKVCIGFSDKYVTSPRFQGSIPRQLTQMTGQLWPQTTTSIAREYAFMIRPLRYFSADTPSASPKDLVGTSTDFAAFCVFNNGKVGINSNAFNSRELVVKKSPVAGSRIVGIQINNETASSDEEQMALLELKAKDPEDNVQTGTLSLNGNTKTMGLTYGDMFCYFENNSKSNQRFTLQVGGTERLLIGTHTITSKSFYGFTVNTISGATPTLEPGLVFYVNNASATTMTDLLLPMTPIRCLVLLKFVNSNTTIKGNDKIRLKGGVNWTPKAYSYLLLIKDTVSSNNWFEVLRDEKDNEAGSTRPTTPRTGQSFFDTTLNIPIYWNGTKWVDATGATV